MTLYHKTAHGYLKAGLLNLNSMNIARRPVIAFVSSAICSIGR